MAATIYPAYAVPLNDIKVNALWDKCFNLNARISGFGLVEIGDYLIVDEGVCISNGIIVHADVQQINITDNLVEPYYFYCNFGFHETLNLPVFGVSRTLLDGYASLAKKEYGTWVSTEASTYNDLKTYVTDHTSNADLHITADEYEALDGADNPSESNLFAKQSDTISYIPVSNNELTLLPISLVAGYGVESFTPDTDGTMMYDIFTSNTSSFIPYGVRELIDPDKIYAKQAKDGYMDDIFGNIIANASSSDYINGGRCTIEQQNVFTGLKTQYTHKVQITAGHGPAFVTWTWPDGLDIDAQSDYIYINIYIPSDENLEYIEISAYDGASYASSKTRYSEFTIDSFNAITLNVEDLTKSSIDYLNLSFKYTDEESSGYYYIDSPATAAFIETTNLTDITQQITAARVSPIVVVSDNASDPKIDLSIDGGSNYLTDLQFDSYVDLSSLPAVAGNYQLRLRFNLFNSGGDFTQIKTPWTDQRKDYMMVSDSQADISVIYGGMWITTQRTDSLIYKRATDTITTGLSNINISVKSSKAVKLGNGVNISGGISSATPSTANYILNWSNNSTISRAALSVRSYDHGATSSGDGRVINFQGIGYASDPAVYEFIEPADSWSTLPNSPNTGQTCGSIIDGYLYAASGSTTGSTGTKFNRQLESWSAMGLNNFVYYSTCAALNSKAIIYESDKDSVERQTYFDYDNQTEYTISAPLTGYGNAATAVYNDDAVSFGPYEKNNTYYTTHSLYVPYKSPRLSGFAVKYII